MHDHLLETLFNDLIDLDAGGRRERLRALRQSDPDLHDRLNRLLEAAAEAQGFLAPPPAGSAEVPTHLGKYAIEGTIGRGAFGVVYRGHDPDLGRFVAIKVLARAALGRSLAARLRDEARTLARINHPNVAQVHSVEEVEAAGRHPLTILTMEYVAGATLAERLEEGPLSAELCLDYGRQIAAALEAAHARSVVHRDLKPQNIRISPGGWVKVLDFGLARLLQAPDAGRQGSSSPGGTPGYMSPEQCREEDVDSRTDLWAFGAILYECLVGSPAVRGDSLEELLRANARGEVRLDRLAAAPSERVAELVRACLAPEREQRLASATIARQVLEEEHLRLKVRTYFPAPAPRSGQPAAGGARGDNLPLPWSSYVGRETLLLDLERHLAASRLVTLVGPGGVGKTRTALELGSRCGHLFPGGRWFVDLASVVDSAAVPGAVARSMGVRETSGEIHVDAVVDAVAAAAQDERMLLILDNCEHVLPGATGFVERLLLRAAPAVVLATSRQPLGLPGEQAVPLRPLALPAADAGAVADVESVQLFLQRARRRAPDFGPGVKGMDLVAAICRGLDGLPLAIELAASHTRSFPLEEILRRVTEGHSLARPAPSDHPRHRSLGELVDWSYRLLAPEEQAFLRRLSVFRGGCTLAAAEQVCGGWGGIEVWEACDLLARLAERSLVELDAPAEAELEADNQPARYRMLETIRTFAGDRLRQDPGEKSGVRGRYLDHCASIAAIRPEEKSDPNVWFGRIEVEYANLVHAIDMALADGPTDVARSLADHLGMYWVQTGQWNEGRRWLDRVIEQRAGGSGDGDHAMRATEVRILSHAGLLSVLLRERERAAGLIAEALALGQEVGDAESLGTAHAAASIAAWLGGDADGTERHGREARSCFEQTGDRRAVAVCTGRIGMAHGMRGDHESALQHHKEHLRLGRDMGDRLTQSKALANIAWEATQLGRVEEARSALEESVAIQEGTRDLHGIAASQKQLGEFYLAQGEIEPARAYLVRSARLMSRLGDRVGLAYTLISLARIAARDGRAELAAEVVGGAERRLAGEFALRKNRYQSFLPFREELVRTLGDEEAARIFARGATQDLAAFLARFDTQP